MRVLGTRPYSRPVQVPKMPAGLVELMEGLTRDVLKNNPPDIYEFCAGHMNKLLEIRDGPTKKVTLTLEEKIVRAQKKLKQKAETRHQKYLTVVQNSNSNGETSNIKIETPLDSQKMSTSALTPSLEHMLKPPIHQDLNLSNASEIEIAHGTDAVISSTSPNVHYKTELLDEVKLEKIPKETVSKTDKQDKDIEKGVTTLNEILTCDTKRNVDKSSYILSENSNDLKSKSENEGIQIIEDQVEPIMSNNETTKDLTYEDSAVSKITNEKSQNHKEEDLKEHTVENINSDKENFEVEIKNYMNLSHKDNEIITLDMTKTVLINEGTNTVITEEQIQNIDDNNQIETEKNDNNVINKEVMNEHVNKTYLQDLSGDNLEEIKIVQESILIEPNEIINDMNQLPIVLEKSHEEVKNDEADNLEQIGICNNSRKGHLHQDHTHDIIIQSDVDPSYENNMSEENGKTKFSITRCNNTDDIQNELQKNNVLKYDNLLTDSTTLNSQINIIDNNSCKENINDGQREFINIDEKISEQLNNDTEVCLEYVNDNISDVKINGEPEIKIVRKSDKRTIPQEVSNKQLEISQSVNLVGNSDMSSEKGDTKNHDNELPIQIEKNVTILNIEDNEQRVHEASNLSILKPEETDTIVSNLSAVVNDHRVKRDIIESAHYDETICSKKSVSGDESTDGNDNTSFIESGASETPDDTSQQSNPNPNAMDLETAAVTIQKVFRTFLFKSRASTFDDTNEENMPLDEESDKKEEIEFQATNVNVGKERRGISRMDTVLQTVNEEKSLSLSTDDSSTLSSAATTIQAHVRGFLVRNKLHSHKTASTNSLVNSDGPSNTSLEGDTELNKNKTVLNIHIVPEGGNYLSREESILTSMDLSLDGSPPSSLNLHPLGYDRNERRKQLKREDAIQSISPPSNNSGKLSEDVDSAKDLLIPDGEVTSNQKNFSANSLTNNDTNTQLQPQSGDTSPTNSTTIETVIEAHRSVDLETSDSKIEEAQENNTKKSLTKMSSDEMDVVTPFKDNPENMSTTELDNASKLMHSGECHDTVLPTQVSRKDTSVVSEFKNVLVYFLLWNNS